jgi:hypothetical protein
MPISREHFDEGRTPSLGERITLFLERHQDKAFTIEELARALKLPAARRAVSANPARNREVERSRAELLATLNLLSGNGKIASKLIGPPGERDVYYSWHEAGRTAERHGRAVR